ncbi:MAG: hypothetical protein Q8Q07_01355 [Dehalococcoidales bacterium]|nr:hypothetical protein [Dehalococcoidales bacterium]
MVMWKLKNCPRCQGDLFVDRDIDGWYAQCLQCSYRRDLKAIAEKSKERRPVMAGDRRSRS